MRQQAPVHGAEGQVAQDVLGHLHLQLGKAPQAHVDVHNLEGGRVLVHQLSQVLHQPASGTAMSPGIADASCICILLGAGCMSCTGMTAWYKVSRNGVAVPLTGPWFSALARS